MSPGFVAAFAQANVGDTSPNIQGAFCRDTGLPCDAVHSTCDGRVKECIGRGPGGQAGQKDTANVRRQHKTRADSTDVRRQHRCAHAAGRCGLLVLLTSLYLPSAT
jgi:hypothetical protein